MAAVTVIGIERRLMIIAVHHLAAMAIQTRAGTVGVAGNPLVHGCGANLELCYTDGNDLVSNGAATRSQCRGVSIAEIDTDKVGARQCACCNRLQPIGPARCRWRYVNISIVCRSGCSSTQRPARGIIGAQQGYRLLAQGKEGRPGRGAGTIDIQVGYGQAVGVVVSYLMTGGCSEASRHSAAIRVGQSDCDGRCFTCDKIIAVSRELKEIAMLYSGVSAVGSVATIPVAGATNAGNVVL